MWTPSESVNLKSLGLSGNVSGTGIFAAHLIYEDKSYLISYFMVNNETITFEDVCEETCTLSGFDDSKYIIKFTLEGVEVKLDNLVYSESALKEDGDVVFNVFSEDPISVTEFTIQAGSSWTPAEIITEAWYDASESTTVWTDSAGTTPATNNSNLRRWDDKSGNDYDLTYISNDPQYITEGINGRGVVWFSGNLDRLGKTGIADINLSEVAIVSVGRSLTAGDTPTFGWVQDTANNDQLFPRIQSANPTFGKLWGVFRLDGVQTTWSSSNTEALAEEKNIIATMWYNGTDVVQRANGGNITVTQDVADGATFTINEIHTGRNPNGENTPRNYQGEMIVLNTADLATIQKVEGYLAHKWNLTDNLPASHPYKTNAPETSSSVNMTNAFSAIWDTTKTSAGSSNSTTIALPLESSGTYNFNVNWGDGSSDTITTWNQAEVNHTYASTGEYKINITGQIEGFRFNDGGDKLKIIDIQQWGVLNVGNSNTYFFGCENLDASATDVLNLTGTTDLNQMFWNAKIFNGNISNWNVSNIVSMVNMFGKANNFNQDLNGWDVSSVTTMRGMFFSATSFNQDLNGWDVSSVTNMKVMFGDATSFDQDLGNWNVSKVRNMQDMFNGVTLSTANYDSLLIGWESQTLQNGVTFSGGNSQYCNGTLARADIISDYAWIITDGGVSPSCDSDAPIITLITPLNTGSETEGIINLTYNVTDENIILNCSLYINNTLNQTSNSVTRNITQLFTVNFPIGTYNWNINCTDFITNSNTSETRALNILSNLFCGDNKISAGEDCDGNIWFAETCETLGYDKGEISCSASCKFDTSDCSYSKSPSEETCEETCENKGFECGTQTICEEDVSCGSCGNQKECINGMCMSDCNECSLNDKKCDSDNLMKCINNNGCNQWTISDTCNDNDACTTSSCENDRCVYDIIDCSDGNACTVDFCEAGVCHNKGMTCESGDCQEGYCTLEEEQDPEQYAPVKEEAPEMFLGKYLALRWSMAISLLAVFLFILSMNMSRIK